MNSKQRRLDRRKWKYTVRVRTDSFEAYIDQWDWLDKRFGRLIATCGWREHRDNADSWDYPPGYTVWEFVRLEDASEFVLRWS